MKRRPKGGKGMCEKCTDLFKDYSKLMDITLDMVLKLKQYTEEKYHYEKIIGILLSGEWSSKHEELFKKYSPEEIAVLVFEKCIIKKIKPEDILGTLERQGILLSNEAS
jgi:hypothetical protein